MTNRTDGESVLEDRITLATLFRSFKTLFKDSLSQHGHLHLHLPRAWNRALLTKLKIKQIVINFLALRGTWWNFRTESHRPHLAYKAIGHFRIGPSLVSKKKERSLYYEKRFWKGYLQDGFPTTTRIHFVFPFTVKIVNPRKA